MILSTEAIVLRTMKYSETSLIATLFTRDHGKMSVLAKGARRKNRPFGAALEPMNHVHAVIYHKPQRDLQLITQCDLVARYPAILADLDRMAIGMAAVELLHLSTGQDEAHPEVFELTLDLFKSLQDATHGHQKALYVYEIKLLGLLGFKPSLRECVSCKKEIGLIEGQMPGGMVRMTGNGIACRNCAATSDAGIALSPAAWVALVAFQDAVRIQDALGVTLTPEAFREIDESLRHLVQVHLTGMRPLRSEQVFSHLR